MKVASIKPTIIGIGAYKPARWLMDHVIDRTRLQAHKALLALLRTIVAPGDVCFDIGANIGDYTAALLAAGASRVVAVDPQPSAVSELRARFARDPRVKIEPVALGATEKTADFYIRRYHGVSGLTENWDSPHVQKIQVPVRTVETLIAIHGKPTYIKIDVEGYENEVLKGLQTKINTLSFEYHLSDEDVASKIEIVEDLQRLGSPTFNLLPESASKFYWDRFVSAREFFDVFPAKLRQNDDPFYGDIFVKITT